MKRSLTIVFVVVFSLGLGGCATPLGQKYAPLGAAGGAIIGGALGGWEGAAAGAAAGGMAGGAYGDHQYRNQQEGSDWSNAPPYSSPEWNGSVRPCKRVLEPVYDYYGNQIGQRPVCR